MHSIKKIIMERDNLSSEEADEQINDAQLAFDTYLADGDQVGAENICEEYFGLEPDYVVEFF